MGGVGSDTQGGPGAEGSVRQAGAWAVSVKVTRGFEGPGEGAETPEGSGAEGITASGGLRTAPKAAEREPSSPAPRICGEGGVLGSGGREKRALRRSTEALKAGALGSAKTAWTEGLRTSCSVSSKSCLSRGARKNPKCRSVATESRCPACVVATQYYRRISDDRLQIRV